MKKSNSFFKKSNIPNYLTIFRILLVPIIIILTCINFGPVVYSYKLNDLYESNFYLSTIIAGALFIVASLTDFIDGFLARKYLWISNFGKLWDPLADKILVNSVMLVFAGCNTNNHMPIYFIIPILMVLRDIIVDGYRMFAASKNIVVAANMSGKLKTTAQMFAIIFIYFFFNMNYNPTNIWYWCVQNLMCWIALGFSLYSGVEYMIKITKLISKK